LIWMILAVWLVSSGLPKTMGLSPAQGRVRRRIWYLLAGGFVAMVALTFLLFYLSFAMAGMVVDLFYWFAWTWFSWLIADKKTARRFRPRCFPPSVYF
jgi:hypothetical protein